MQHSTSHHKTPLLELQAYSVLVEIMNNIAHEEAKIYQKSNISCLLSSLFWNSYSITLPFCYCTHPLYHWHCSATLPLYFSAQLLYHSTILPLTICSYYDSKNTYKLDFIDLNLGLVSFIQENFTFPKLLRSKFTS